MLLPMLAVTVALVVQDQTALRASSHDAAPRQAMLTPGDWLEVRGEHQGYLQVYDHRRERAGYVRTAAVRRYDVDEANAPKLGTLVEYLEDMSGSESLGIGYAALFLRAAPAKSIGPEVFDAIGTMAERLARRASAKIAKSGDAPVAGQLETAESYGVHFASFEKLGATHVCYDGEAYRRVLAMENSTGSERVRAALGSSDPECLDPARGPSDGLESARSAVSAIESVDPATLGPEVGPEQKARLFVRSATAHAELAYFLARTGDLARSKDAAVAARTALLRVDRVELADADRLAYDEAAIHVGAVRWATEEAPATHDGVAVAIAPGEPGQTCVEVTRGKAEPFRQCTYAVVWPGSVRVAPHGSAITMVTTPLAGWSELLVLRPGDGGYGAETLTPATIDPDLGYAELAGVSPDGAHLLVVRESRASGPLGAPGTLAPWAQRTFQELATSDLHVEKQATSLTTFATFKRWEAPEWRAGSVALR